MMINTAAALKSALLAAALLLTACSTKSRTLTPEGLVSEDGVVANTATFTDGAFTSSLLSSEPSQLVADADGVDLNTSGIGTAGGLEGIGAFWSPKDVEIRDAMIEFPDGRKITIGQFSSSASAPILAGNPRAEILKGLLENFSRDEAEARVQQWVEAGNVTASLGAQILAELFPTP